MPNSPYGFSPIRISGVLAVALIWSSPASGDEARRPRVEYSAIQAGMGGVSLYVPGKWGILNLAVKNPLEESHELLSTTYFDGQPTLQFGRRIWLPARSQLSTWQPVLSPSLPPGARDRFEFHSLVFDASRADDVATRDVFGQMLHSGILPAQLETPLTGLVDIREVNGLEDTAHDLVAASRVNQGLSPRMVSFPGQSFSPDYVSFSPDDVSWQSLHQLVVADSRALDDPAGLPAIRRWVHGGGRLWVMLDRADPGILERVLGDEFVCDVVDRVGLTSVRIEPTSSESGAPPVESEYEQPVDLVRVVVTGADVAYTVNGWPAAFWKSFGAGRILVTTLAPRGWMRARTAADAEFSSAPVDAPNAARANRFVPLPPMIEMAKEFLMQPRTLSRISRILEPQVSEYIGYSIPPRWLIVSLLGGFVAAVVVLGTWLLRRSALEHLGWLSPGLAICVATVLLIIGVLNRHTIPETAATVEFVEAIPGTDDIRTRGAVALYNPESRAAVIGTTHGGRLIPDMSGLEGSIKRLVWKDLDTWNWENLAMGAGERLGTFAQSETLPERFEARGTFGPEGLSGRLSVPGVADLGDALIATRLGRMGVELGSDGKFRAAVESVFGQDQYLAAGLLSDEQDRRRRIYAQVLPELFHDDSSGRPLLLLWADRRSTALQFDQARRLLGASFVAIPLVLERPPVNTRVRIPTLFLPFRNTAHPDGRLSSPLWDHRRQEWMERSNPASAWFRFQLPVELLPVELTSARLVISVAGPVGRVEVSALRRKDDGGHRNDDRSAVGDAVGSGRDEVLVVKTWHAPVGTLSPAEIVDSDLLQTDAGGGLLLGLTAGEIAPPASTVAPTTQGSRISSWRIERLSLELSGTIAP